MADSALLTQSGSCPAALAHQADFDVCWCKGSVAERIFTPLTQRIESQGAKILGGRFVTDVAMGNGGAHVVGVKTRDRSGREEELQADAVVFAVGINGAWGVCAHDCLLSFCLMLLVSNVK